MGVDMEQLGVPNVTAIAKDHDPEQLVRLIQLVLGCLVKNENNQYYSANILQLGPAAQQALMRVIGEVRQRRLHRLSCHPRGHARAVAPPARARAHRRHAPCRRGAARATCGGQIVPLIESLAPEPAQARLPSLGFK